MNDLDVQIERVDADEAKVHVHGLFWVERFRAQEFMDRLKALAEEYQI